MELSNTQARVQVQVAGQLLVLNDAVQVVMVKARLDQRCGASMVEEDPEMPKVGCAVHAHLAYLPPILRGGAVPSYISARRRG